MRPEQDGWTAEGPKITDKLEDVKRIFEDEGPIVVIHRLYRGMSAPDRYVFEYYEHFEEWLLGKTFAGDVIEIWSLWRIEETMPPHVDGKVPDDLGEVPTRGAY